MRVDDCVTAFAEGSLFGLLLYQTVDDLIKINNGDVVSKVDSLRNYFFIVYSVCISINYFDNHPPFFSKP